MSRSKLVRTKSAHAAGMRWPGMSPDRFRRQTGLALKLESRGYRSTSYRTLLSQARGAAMIFLCKVLKQLGGMFRFCGRRIAYCLVQRCRVSPI
jgi:hypothetical protein